MRGGGFLAVVAMENPQERAKLERKIDEESGVYMEIHEHFRREFALKIGRYCGFSTLVGPLGLEPRTKGL